MELAYFDNIQQVILQELQLAKKSIKIAVAWFTNESIFDKIIEKKNAGISVDLIILNDFINSGPYGLDFQNLINRGGVLRYSTNQNPIHHKFCIIDDLTLINGSYNWTYYAENKNLENILIIKDNKPLISKYTQYFKKLTGTLKKALKSDKLLNDIANSGENTVNEYVAFDLYFKGKQTNSIKDIEKATRLLPTSTALADEYKAMTSVKIKKALTTSIGIESVVNGVDGCFSILVEKGKLIPCSNSGTYTTTEDNQKSIQIQTYKGYHKLTRYNQKIGEFEIGDLPTKPAGQAEVKVTFNIDETGRLTVIAENYETGSHMSALYEITDLVF